MVVNEHNIFKHLHFPSFKANVHSCSYFFERFREGLRTLGMFEQVQMCSETFYSVFCGPVERLTAESVMELFTTRLSEEKEKQAKENATINFWKQYLHECEGAFVTFRMNMKRIINGCIWKVFIPALVFQRVSVQHHLRTF